MLKNVLSLCFVSVFLFSFASNKKAEMSYMEAATLWMQNAAEVRALTYQAFNAAKLKLSMELKKKHKRPLAVILDIDETVLDNSPYQARNILEGRTYEDENW